MLFFKCCLFFIALCAAEIIWCRGDGRGSLKSKYWLLWVWGRVGGKELSKCNISALMAASDGWPQYSSLLRGWGAEVEELVVPLSDSAPPPPPPPPYGSLPCVSNLNYYTSSPQRLMMSPSFLVLIISSSHLHSAVHILYTCSTTVSPDTVMLLSPVLYFGSDFHLSHLHIYWHKAWKMAHAVS